MTNTDVDRHNISCCQCEDVLTGPSILHVQSTHVGKRTHSSGVISQQTMFTSTPRHCAHSDESDYSEHSERDMPVVFDVDAEAGGDVRQRISVKPRRAHTREQGTSAMFTFR